MSARPLLYVDDERNNRLVFQHSVGVRLPVLIASCGDEALELLARENVCALLADQRMPEMTGVALAREVRARFPGLPRFILTAYPQDRELVAALEEKLIDRLFTKPWDAEQLVRELGPLVGRAG
jgi:CheY-like chemotaxis protein